MKNGSIKNGTILSQSTGQVGLGLRDSQPGEAQPEQGRPAPVAQLITPDTLVDESNPISYQTYADQIISSLMVSFGPRSPLGARRIFQKAEKLGIFNSQTLSALYLIKNEKVVTYCDLTEQLEMPEPTAHRILKQLTENKFIVNIAKIKKRKIPGPRITLWAIKDYDEQSLESCLKRQEKRSSYATGRGYAVYEELTQLTLNEYITPRNLKEIRLQELARFLKNNYINRTYAWKDIYEKVSLNLHNKGIKVWR